MKHTTLRGEVIDPALLTPEESAMFTEAQKEFQSSPKWSDFKNRWLNRVVTFYDSKSFERRASLVMPLFRAVQDMGSRLMVDAGLARLPDYRKQIESIIETKFDTRRQFCDATGLSEDMLSHVLHGRKDLSIGTLTEALTRIGYGLSIVPLARERAG